MLEKFIKKDRNEILESVLDQKDVDEKTKNLLQGILYKIDVSYKDYQKSKVIQKNKKEYLDILYNLQGGHHCGKTCMLQT